MGSERRSGLGLLAAYRILLTALTPVIGVMLLIRLLQGKEDARRLPERLGFASAPRPPGPLVWLHAASVGELSSLLPLLRELDLASRRAGWRPPSLLVTSVTRTSARMAASLLPSGVMHQYAPVDHWAAVGRFRRHWQPDLALLAEAELWPELVHAMPRLHLINARMSERSFRRHGRFPWFAAWLFRRVHSGFAQSEPDARRLRRLGLRRVEAVGSTKWDAEPLRMDPALRARLEACRAGRRVLLLASSHRGEEEMLLEAWPRLHQALGSLLLLLVPRHPERAGAIRDLARQRQLRALTWEELTAMADPGSASTPDAVVVDRLGSMGSWLAAADLVVMGGSLAPQGRCVGGHNPLEPVRAGKVVVCGPDMANFAGLTETLAAAGWLHQFPTAGALWTGVVALLQTPPPSPPPLQLEGPSASIARRVLDALASGPKLLPMAPR